LAVDLLQETRIVAESCANLSPRLKGGLVGGRQLIHLFRMM
jgi:hypothetical protein